MRIVAAVVCGVMVSACGPRIHAFAVTPARRCSANEPVVVTLSVRGDTSLLVGAPRVGRNTDTVRYELVVTKRGKVVNAAQDVVTYRGSDTDTLVLGPSARLNPDSLIVRDSLTSDFWPAFVRIQRLASASDRPLHVTHNGSTALVTADGAPTLFDGMSVSGAWELRAALLPGEKFATPGHNPPDRLRLEVIIRCVVTGATP